MEIKNRFKNALAAFTKIENKGPDPNAFLKYGNRKMPSTWSTPEISDEDFYTGYGFAVVNKRANRSVVLGKNFLYTDAKEEIIKKANEENNRVTHPYLSLIQDSIDFAQRDFWYDISTYLDLEGIYYLMAVRTVTSSGVVGQVQKFVLLNPYNVRPVVNPKGELGGYVEQNGNKQREIPKEMMIVIRLLNPFDQSRTYSLADAARDSQFTMKQANDFAREAIDGNLNAPGIIASAIELPDDQFDNFVDRVKNHGRGEPLFGNGAGTVTWTNMQTDLDKAALDKINNISRDTLLAVSGLSKTGVGVEESGTGREVSRTQKDDFTENAVMPQIENIIDALNLDYRRYYQELYKKNKYNIALSNPLETNKDAEQADVDIRDSQFALMQSLVDKGYAYDIASKYAKGLLDITDIGEAPEPPKPDPTPPPAPVDPPADPPKKEKKAKDSKPKASTAEVEIYEGYPVPLTQYLQEYADQITSHSEKSSTLHLTEETDKVRITEIKDREGSLIGVIDENSYAQLGKFNEGADREAILTILNKRYHNQLVAVKHKGIKRDLNKDFYQKLTPGVPQLLDNITEKYQDREWFEEAFNDYREHVLDSSPDQIKLPGVAFKKYLKDVSGSKISQLIKVEEQEHFHKFTSAAFDEQEQIDVSTGALLNSVQNTENRMFDYYLEKVSEGELAPGATLDSYINDLSLPFAVWFTVMFPIFASQRAVETATQLGVDTTPVTVMTDDVKDMINNFARREATSHVNTVNTDILNALTIIRAQTSDPAEITRMLQSAFVDIQRRRAELVASNASGRIFALSQYEADLQLLTRTDLVKKAYKQLYSSTGAPCSICATIIGATNSAPIPFTDAFASLGDTITTKERTMNFNYEEILAGNVHPNCKCYYKIEIKEEAANSVEDKHNQMIESVRAEIAPLLEKIHSDKDASDQTMQKIEDATARLDNKIELVEDKLDQLDKRTKEARQLKEELLEANELKTKLSEAEAYASQLESIIDGQV